MTMHVKDGGTWKQVSSLSVKDGGTWKAVTAAWVKDGGTWKQFLSSNVALPGVSVQGVAYAGLRFKTDGTVQYSYNGSLWQYSHNWYTPTTGGIGSGYWVRATLVSGGDPTTGTLDSWLQLSADRTWSNSAGSGQIETSSLTMEIATDSGGSNIVATSLSGVYVIDADNI